MSEEKQRGWAPVAEREREKMSPEPEVPFYEDEDMVEFEKNRVLAPLVTNSLLVEVRDLLIILVNEMKRANATVAGYDGKIDFVEAQEAPEFDIPVPKIPEGEPEVVPTPVLNSEEEIVEYFKDKLQKWDDDGYQLSEKSLDGFEFGIEEDKVIMVAPWIGKEHFASFANYVRKEMEGDYIKGERHFVLSRP